MRKTKIVATLGPASNSTKIIKGLINAGMNSARINFSHGTHESHGEIIKKLKEAREAMNVPVSLLLDTKGPEIRIKSFKVPSIFLKKGNTFTLCKEDIEGDETRVSVTYSNLADDVSIGSKIFLDDALIELKVNSIDGHDVECIVMNDGELTANKGVNLPDSKVNLPSLTQKDIEDIKFGIENGFDFVAASFVRSAKDVLEIRQVLDEFDGSSVSIIAKIESREGVDNLESILEVADGIMVARGDLGVEIPPEEVPLVQKKLIQKANSIGKPVITATQMLESMVSNPRPTRAEANDVANAIFDGTDAIMLSGETAKGAYPVEAVRMMNQIALQIEGSQDYNESLKLRHSNNIINVTNAVSYASCNIASDLGASTIVTVTNSGFTARMIAKYKPNCPILVATANKVTLRQVNLSWGCFPKLVSQYKNQDELFESANKSALSSEFAKNGDVIVIVAGVPVGITGSTNLVRVQIAGDMLTKGRGIGSGKVVGKSFVIKPSEDFAQRAFQDGDILVASTTNDDMIPYIRKAGAIIIGSNQNIDTMHAEISCKALNKPLIICNDRIIDLIRTGTTLTIDCDKGFVYNGDIDAK